MKKVLLGLFVLFASFTLLWGVLAQDKQLGIMQDLTESEVAEAKKAIEEIWDEPWNVMNKYRDIADRWNGRLWMQMLTWIMNWNTIPNYLVFVVQFLSDLWLVVGVLFIMYAWYKYMISVINGWKVPNETVKNAIIWVIIVIFSYAILKTLTSLIWIS